MAICASLAAPLLKITHHDSFGIHFWGRSTTGKTTAARMANSVWGPVNEIRTWRTTINGAEGMASLRKDALLCLDEIDQTNGTVVNEAVYLLANGTGKARAMFDGSLRPTQNWRTVIMSTGEKTVLEKLAEYGVQAQAGQSVRLIDIPADAEKGMGIFEELHGHQSPALFATELRNAVETHYGYPSRHFCTYLAENLERLNAELPTQITEKGLEFLPQGSGQVLRVAQIFALCAIAGNLGVDSGLLPWSHDEVHHAVNACFTDWQLERGSLEDMEASALAERVSGLLEEKGNSLFPDIDQAEYVYSRRAGVKVMKKDKALYYCLPGYFKGTLCRGTSTRQACKILYEAGMLLKNSTATGYQTRLPKTVRGLGRPNCYVLQLPE